MLTDSNKGITGITYNHLNLPKSVSIGGGTITYIYDATGVKQRKLAGTTTTDYAGNFMYKNGTLQFFKHPEGYVENNAGTYKYHYQYKDHLGNIRLSYFNNGTASSPSAAISEENNYYPFGLRHKGYNDAPNGYGNSAAKMFKFGGKEFQDESFGGKDIDWYDFHARNYDAALGRWMNVDPLAEKMRRHSPYNYAFDNPIYFVDYDGMMPQSNCCPDLQRLGRAIKKTIIESTTKSVNQVKNYFAKVDNNSWMGNTKQTADGGLQLFVSRENKKDGIATPNSPNPGADITSGDGDGIAILAESQPGPNLSTSSKAVDLIVAGTQLFEETVTTVNSVNGNKGSIDTANTSDNKKPVPTVKCAACAKEKRDSIYISNSTDNNGKLSRLLLAKDQKNDTDSVKSTHFTDKK